MGNMVVTMKLRIGTSFYGAVSLLGFSAMFSRYIVGSGKYIWSDGRIYEGEWRRGMRHGHGKTQSGPSRSHLQGAVSRLGGRKTTPIYGLRKHKWGGSRWWEALESSHCLGGARGSAGSIHRSPGFKQKDHKIQDLHDPSPHECHVTSPGGHHREYAKVFR
ncbi:hypothetical protein Scep_010143 [Stephania cephalantha]|uniref:Uncharacterized protein n=1 Tax=Stephania cephalantha TaxID=152367 RepID=A0AAP0JWY2_9MAGN